MYQWHVCPGKTLIMICDCTAYYSLHTQITPPVFWCSVLTLKYFHRCLWTICINSANWHAVKDKHGKKLMWSEQLCVWKYRVPIDNSNVCSILCFRLTAKAQIHKLLIQGRFSRNRLYKHNIDMGRLMYLCTSAHPQSLHTAKSCQ